MKQFFNILKFEFLNVVKTKTYMILTIAVLIIAGGILFYPRIEGNPKAGGEQSDPNQYSEGSLGAAISWGSEDKIAISGNDTLFAVFENESKKLENSFEIVKFEGGEDDLKKAVENGEYTVGLVFTSPLEYKYIIETTGVFETPTLVLDELVLQNYRIAALANLGVEAEQAGELFSVQVNSEIVITGKDQSSNFFYTYILIFLLYMTIMMYGQMVASGVAAEKSSRAMELLITSAKPTSLMFGKVFGIGFAGLMQIAMMLLGTFAFYALNKSYWADNAIVSSIFGMPLNIALYTMLFFLLGYFFYAFVYGAMGSLASRLEEVNTLIVPVLMLMVVNFFFAFYIMMSNSINSTLAKVCSFVPITSPLVMFMRIALGEVAGWEIGLSVAILAASIFIVGMLATAIYRVGVLLYGKIPNPKELYRLIKKKG